MVETRTYTGFGRLQHRIGGDEPNAADDPEQAKVNAQKIAKAHEKTR